MKTCSRGHVQNTRNCYVKKNGVRECRVCRREQQRERYAREFRSDGLRVPGHTQLTTER